MQTDLPNKDSPDETWVTSRTCAELVLIWGCPFANGGQVSPQNYVVSNKKAAKNLDRNVFVTGMVLRIQQCRDGRRVLGGLKMFYENDGGESDWIQINDSDCECHEFHLENDERIVKVDVNSGRMIQSLTFHTRRG